jgi:molecular chaperone GrpE
MKEKKHGKNRPAEPAPAAESTPPAAPPPPAPEAALTEQLLRLQADYENFRKRVQRERVESQQQAAAQLILALLPALDHFLLGLKNTQAHAQDKTLVTGFQMIYGQLMDALQQTGLAPLAVAGQPFDPNQHEAVTTVASEEHPEGTVITEVRRGYTLGGKLLRAAQVIVSSGPPAPATPVTPPPTATAAPEPTALPEEGAD